MIGNEQRRRINQPIGGLLPQNEGNVNQTNQGNNHIYRSHKGSH